DVLKAQALAQLEKAGGRALELGAPVDSRRHFEHALNLAIGERHRAQLSERLGQACTVDADYPAAQQYLQSAHAYYELSGDTAGLTRVLAAEGYLGFRVIRIADTLAALSAGYEAVCAQPPSAELALIAIGIGRCHFFLGE